MDIVSALLVVARARKIFVKVAGRDDKHYVEISRGEGQSLLRRSVATGSNQLTEFIVTNGPRGTSSEGVAFIDPAL